MRLLRLLLAGLLGTGMGPVAAAGDAGAGPDPDRRIAITIDDLPWQHIHRTSPQALASRHARLMTGLRRADAPVVGFVNEGKLEHEGELIPERVALLRDWLDAGAELGNHTFGHLDLHAVGIDAYTADILRGERQLRTLLSERGQVPRWFRHPYLRAGITEAERTTLDHFLREHGYRIAPVTVDNSEWIWALAYQSVLDAERNGQDPQLQRLEHDYITYMLDKLAYYEQQSIALLGYALPQIWLLHANALNAAAYSDLVAAARARGYRTITLDEALADAAYAHADGYRGRYGPSWLHRWAMAEQRPREFYGDEPVVPAEVLALAQIESE